MIVIKFNTFETARQLLFFESMIIIITEKSLSASAELTVI